MLFSIKNKGAILAKRNVHYIEMYERLNIISVKHSINIPDNMYTHNMYYRIHHVKSKCREILTNTYQMLSL